MATPKGTRSYRLPLTETDAVHVYSNKEGIWLQLRRLVPTENDICEASFKTAMELSPEIARLLAKELAKVADSPGPRKKPRGEKSTPTLELGTCPHCKETQLIEHLGRGWCPLCGEFDRWKSQAVLPPPSKEPQMRKKPKVIDLISGLEDEG